MKLILDFETYSVEDIKKGVVKYATHPSTEILCLAYMHESGTNIHTWVPSDGNNEVLKRLFKAIEDGYGVVAHNASFEYHIWNNLLTKFGAPKLNLEQMDCTQSRCAALSLPLSLENACEVLNLQQKKDKEGHNLMRVMTKPRKPTKKDKRTRIDDPESLKRLVEYCKIDVIATKHLHTRIFKLKDYEKKVWVVDQKINNRGIKIDIEAVKAIQNMCEEHRKHLSDMITPLTEGRVEKASQTKVLLKFIQEIDPSITSLDKESLKMNLDRTDLDTKVREILNIRKNVSKSSTAKFSKMLECETNGVITGSYQYCGAGRTGRWAGRSVQFQNVPSAPSDFDVDLTIQKFKTLEYGQFKEEFFDVLTAASNCLRGMCIPRRKYLRICDYSSIEARILFWLANCEIGLEIYKGDGRLYEFMAATIFHCKISDIEKGSKERKLGKTVILACGYGMGIDKFYENAIRDVPDLDRYIVESAHKEYRETFPEVPELWKSLESAAKEAIKHPEKWYGANRIKYIHKHGNLYCKLPSGRLLCYYKCKLEKVEKFGGVRDQIVYYGTVNRNKWLKQHTYGGKLAENVIQAISRDIQANALIKADEKGLKVVMHTHDELVDDSNEDNIDSLKEVMLDLPKWAEGLPVDAEGEVVRRYKK